MSKKVVKVAIFVLKWYKFNNLQVALTLHSFTLQCMVLTLHEVEVLPNEFTLCNTLHDFLTLHCQKYYLRVKLLPCFTLHELFRNCPKGFGQKSPITGNDS